MIACRHQPSTVSNLSGVSYKASDAHTKMVALSRPVSSTKLGLSWATESRILLRVSRITRVLTLTRLDTPTLGVLGGVSGLHTLDGPNRASAKNVRESSGKSSNRNKASKGQISPHTQPTTPFPSGCNLLVRIQDDWCRVIKASPRPRDWLGLPQFRLDRLARRCWLLS